MSMNKNMEEIQIIEQTVRALATQWNDVDNFISYKCYNGKGSENMYVITISGIDFNCIVENEVNGTNFLRIKNRVEEYRSNNQEPFMLVASYVNPFLYEDLRRHNINVADTAGNCQIRYTNGANVMLQLSHTGEKEPVSIKKSYPLFQEAGLKVIFLLLQNPDNVSKTYREIKELSDVSLGTVKNIIDELIARKYILISKRKRVLKERRQLLDLWAENYNRILKPKLFVARLAFRSQQYRERWQEISLPEGMYWSGEAASYILNGYLLPQSFELFTDIPISMMMKTGAVRTADGEILVYRKFWKGDTLPYILIYADLVGSENSRCIEAAQKLLDNELSDFK